MLVLNPVLLFLEMNTKLDIWENAHIALYHTMKVDGDWGCQAKKQDSCSNFQMILCNAMSLCCSHICILWLYNLWFCSYHSVSVLKWKCEFCVTAGVNVFLLGVLSHLLPWGSHFPFLCPISSSCSCQPIAEQHSRAGAVIPVDLTRDFQHSSHSLSSLSPHLPFSILNKSWTF